MSVSGIIYNGFLSFCVCLYREGVTGKLWMYSECSITHICVTTFPVVCVLLQCCAWCASTCAWFDTVFGHFNISLSSAWWDIYKFNSLFQKNFFVVKYNDDRNECWIMTGRSISESYCFSEMVLDLDGFVKSRHECMRFLVHLCTFGAADDHWSCQEGAVRQPDQP